MFTKRDIVIHLKKIVREIRGTGIHLQKVILYGSYARNEQTQWSDVDIAIIADEFTGIGFEDTKLFSKIMIRYPELNIQPRTYNTNDFSTDTDPFVAEILRTGIEIKV